MATYSSILAWRISWTWTVAGYSPWGHKESDITERLTHTQPPATEKYNNHIHMKKWRAVNYTTWKSKPLFPFLPSPTFICDICAVTSWFGKEILNHEFGTGWKGGFSFSPASLFPCVGRLRVTILASCPTYYFLWISWIIFTGPWFSRPQIQGMCSFTFCITLNTVRRQVYVSPRANLSFR